MFFMGYNLISMKKEPDQIWWIFQAEDFGELEDKTGKWFKNVCLFDIPGQYAVFALLAAQ